MDYCNICEKEALINMLDNSRFSERYASLSEKKNLPMFEFPTFTCLHESLQELVQQGYYFRGQSSSLFKITSSIQRAWHSGGCWKCENERLNFKKFMIGLLEFAKKQNDIFSCPKNTLRDHEVWAYLQHYGCPTPFIDFSNDPYVALYFALLTPDMTNGCSIYAIQPQTMSPNKTQDLMSLDDYIANADESESRVSHIKRVSHDKFAFWGFLNSNETINETELASSPPSVEEAIGFYVMKNGIGWCPKIFQGRIARQLGLFIYTPLEKSPLENFIALKNMRHDDCEHKGNVYQKIKCLDIHAEMVQEMKFAISEKCISKESLGLGECEEERRVKTMYENYLKTLEKEN